MEEKVEGCASKVILCLTLLFFLFGCGQEKITYQKVDANKTKELMDQGATLIDVRELVEFKDGHIPKAINIPSDEVADKVEVLFQKSEPIIVYCRSGSRSQMVAQTLVSMGYTHVYDLGSVDNWTLTALQKER